MPATQTPTASVFAENRQFKAYPTDQQAAVLLKMQRAYQLWWNQILDWTAADFEQKSLKTGMTGLVKYSKEVSFYRNALKRLDPDSPMLILSMGSLSMILKKQLVSWEQVFDRLAKNKKNGSALPIGKPRFKSHHQRRSESIPFVFDKRFASSVPQSAALTKTPLSGSTTPCGPVHAATQPINETGTQRKTSIAKVCG